MSHPAWVCGLKQAGNRLHTQLVKSHPAWVCGLKPVILLLMIVVPSVTPCVGVWIET